MELDRKAFHFDLDNKSVERFYTGKKNPWSDIQDFLESHCFEKPQYSGYESAENIVMSYQRAYGTVLQLYQTERLARSLVAYPNLHGTQRIHPYPVFRV